MGTKAKHQAPCPFKGPISDHALLRYLERVWGMDLSSWRARFGKDYEIVAALRNAGLGVDDIRASLLSPQLVIAIRLGGKKVIIGNVTFVIENGTVTTCFVRPFENLPAQRINRHKFGNMSGGSVSSLKDHSSNHKRLAAIASDRLEEAFSDE